MDRRRESEGKLRLVRTRPSDAVPYPTTKMMNHIKSSLFNLYILDALWNGLQNLVKGFYFQLCRGVLAYLPGFASFLTGAGHGVRRSLCTVNRGVERGGKRA